MLLYTQEMTDSHWQCGNTDSADTSAANSPSREDEKPKESQRVVIDIPQKRENVRNLSYNVITTAIQETQAGKHPPLFATKVLFAINLTLHSAEQYTGHL